MYVTNKTEEDDKLNGSTKMDYIACIKGVNRRRTINCCLIWAM
jgi:hypothetical protein